MQKNHTLFRVVRPKLSMQALGALAVLAAGMQIGAPRAQAVEPHLYHKLCDPRAPADDLRQAARCTTIDAYIKLGGQNVTVDRIWMKIDGACKVERRDGSTLTAPGDDSEPNYEFGGQVKLPVDVKWTFPSGCSLLGHVREPDYVADVSLGLDWSDWIEYFKIAASQVTGDTVRLTLNVDDGSVAPRNH